MAKFDLSPVFQPISGVMPIAADKVQHSAMMHFALSPVTRLLYLNGWTEHKDTL